MSKPRWVRCPDCDDFFCTLHQEHAYDCECPTLEELLEEGTDPYFEGGPDDA